MRNKPDYSKEMELGGIVCGVDEAGRGPLAGPVIAAAVVLHPGGIPHGLNDSKKLSPSARERLYFEIETKCQVGVYAGSVALIDHENILAASLAAMRQAILRLPCRPEHALIDGNRLPSDLPCSGHAVIDGDALCLSIAAASIVAKVLRDRLMVGLSPRYPVYGWAENKGYPTPAHRAALARFGPSPHHRRSFRPVQQALDFGERPDN
ncbi:MAG: ribonuclease HII [Alphaproteobacteria bacterium]|nr:ribonuclease HII [Alphaproteobacteria bacterium]